MKKMREEALQKIKNVTIPSASTPPVPVQKLSSTHCSTCNFTPLSGDHSPLSLSGLDLRLETRGANISCDFVRLGIDVCCIQVTRFSTLDRKYVLAGRFVYSDCLKGPSEGVSWLVSKSLNEAYALVFQDSVAKSCLLDDIIEASLIGFSTPTDHTKRADLFR